MTARNSFCLTVLVLILMMSIASAEIYVTVYNSDLGVVRETRQLDFKKGMSRVSIIDVPTRIDPTSVGFEIPDKSKAVSILEQNYAYDLVSPEKIYAKYIDHDIDIFNKDGQLFSGTLLSFNNGSLVLRDKSDKIQVIRMNEVVNVNFPELPDGLITRPTLFWLYNSSFDGQTDAYISYQTHGMRWTAEYVGILSDDETSLGINGWASINNNSGATFKDAVLKLIAGDIHRAPAPRGGRMEMLAKATPMADDTFVEKEFFEYHLYTLPRPATLANNEIKQLSLFDPSPVGVKKEFHYYPDQYGNDVRVMLKFKNSKDDGLGIPLPAGRVRVFKADTDESMILLGEDRVDHTPKDEEVKLTIGNAFDIRAEINIVDQTRLSNKIEEQDLEITLRNHKNEDVEINVEKRLYGYWEIIESSMEYEKKSTNEIKFLASVAANDTTVIKFKVRFNR